MCKLEYKAKIGVNCNKNLYIIVTVLCCPSHEHFPHNTIKRNRRQFNSWPRILFAKV